MTSTQKPADVSRVRAASGGRRGKATHRRVGRPGPQPLQSTAAPCCTLSIAPEQGAALGLGRPSRLQLCIRAPGCDGEGVDAPGLVGGPAQPVAALSACRTLVPAPQLDPRLCLRRCLIGAHTFGSRVRGGRNLEERARRVRRGMRGWGPQSDGEAVLVGRELSSWVKVGSRARMRC